MFYRDLLITDNSRPIFFRWPLASKRQTSEKKRWKAFEKNQNVKVKLGGSHASACSFFYIFYLLFVVVVVVVVASYFADFFYYNYFFPFFFFRMRAPEKAWERRDATSGLDSQWRLKWIDLTGFYRVWPSLIEFCYVPNRFFFKGIKEFLQVDQVHRAVTEFLVAQFGCYRVLKLVDFEWLSAAIYRVLPMSSGIYWVLLG